MARSRSGKRRTTRAKTGTSDKPVPNAFLVALRKRVSGPRGMKRFSKLCGIPYTTYRNYELGRNRVPFEAARAISRATGEKASSIMAGREMTEDDLLQSRTPPPDYVLRARGRVKLDGFSEKKDLKERIEVHVTAEAFGKGDDFLKGGNRLALFARGTAMHPAVFDGDLLVFDTAGRPASGDIVLASAGGKMKVARYFRDRKRKLVFLRFENPRLAPDLLREGKPEARKFKVRGVLVSLLRSRFR